MMALPSTNTYQPGDIYPAVTLHPTLTCQPGDLHPAMTKLQSEVTQLKINMATLQAKVAQLEGQEQSRLSSQSACHQNRTSDDGDFNESEFFRHCMAKALQKNMVKIVELIPYNSEIPDVLISGFNFNDSEHDTITNKKKDSKAMMRSLVLRMRHRDLKAMTALVNTFKHHNHALYNSVWSTYESLKITERVSYGRRRCSTCLLMDGVCLCDLVDHLDQGGLLLPKVHLKIAESNAEFVDEKPLWNLLLYSIAEKNCRRAIEVIIEALEKKGPFCERIIQSLRKDLAEGRNALRCVCNGSVQRLDSSVKRDFDCMSTSSDDQPKSSSSDGAIKADTVKRRRKSTCYAKKSAWGTLKHSVILTKSKSRTTSGRRSASVTKSTFKFRTSNMDRSMSRSPKQWKGGKIASERTQLAPQNTENTNHAITQWRKLKIITFFLTKLLVKLSKPVVQTFSFHR